MPEFFDAFAHRSAGGPDVVKENISGCGVERGVCDGIGVSYLVETSSAVGTDLDGVFGALENGVDLISGKFREMFGEEKSMVKSTFSDVTIDGR